MEVIKSCGLLVVALVAVISCGGGDSESNLSNDSSSQQDLKDSYSFTLPVEIKSDQSINLTLASTKSNGASNITVIMFRNREISFKTYSFKLNS